MSDAAQADKVYIRVESAYRSYVDQAATFDQMEAAHGSAYALQAAARPGHSEHQLGTTIDFAGGGPWLADNAWLYGFVLSYPALSSPSLTCYQAEPWHYRYFGRDTAAAIHDSALSPREWLWIHA